MAGSPLDVLLDQVRKKSQEEANIKYLDGTDPAVSAMKVRLLDNTPVLDFSNADDLDYFKRAVASILPGLKDEITPLLEVGGAEAVENATKFREAIVKGYRGTLVAAPALDPLAAALAGATTGYTSMRGTSSRGDPGQTVTPGFSSSTAAKSRSDMRTGYVPTDEQWKKIVSTVADGIKNATVKHTADNSSVTVQRDHHNPYTVHRGNDTEGVHVTSVANPPDVEAMVASFKNIAKLSGEKKCELSNAANPQVALEIIFRLMATPPEPSIMPKVTNESLLAAMRTEAKDNPDKKLIEAMELYDEVQHKLEGENNRGFKR